MAERTSLIVRCSREDAARARNEASSERRSLSGYLLHILERWMLVEDQFMPKTDQAFFEAQARSVLGRRHKEARTAVHLRCTVDEAARIRHGAARRRLSISDFVVFSLRCLWRAHDRIQGH